MRGMVGKCFPGQTCAGDYGQWMYLDRAKAYRALVDAANAEEDEKKVAELNKKYALMKELKFSPPKTDKEKEIEGFSELVEEIPANPYAYNLRGLSYYKYNDFRNAIPGFSQAIKLDAEYAAAYHNRAVAYMTSKDLKLSEGAFSSAFAQPENEGVSNQGFLKSDIV
jgi:tetratricopeptide (TPR) repeat protein